MWEIDWCYFYEQAHRNWKFRSPPRVGFYSFTFRKSACWESSRQISAPTSGLGMFELWKKLHNSALQRTVHTKLLIELRTLSRCADYRRSTRLFLLFICSMLRIWNKIPRGKFWLILVESCILICSFCWDFEIGRRRKKIISVIRLSNGSFWQIFSSRSVFSRLSE